MTLPTEWKYKSHAPVPTHQHPPEYFYAIRNKAQKSWEHADHRIFFIAMLIIPNFQTAPQHLPSIPGPPSVPTADTSKSTSPWSTSQPRPTVMQPMPCGKTWHGTLRKRWGHVTRWCPIRLWRLSWCVYNYDFNLVDISALIWFIHWLISGGRHILDGYQWRYCTMLLAILCGDIPWNLGLKNWPYIQ